MYIRSAVTDSIKISHYYIEEALLYIYMHMQIQQLVSFRHSIGLRLIFIKSSTCYEFFTESLHVLYVRTYVGPMM